MRLVAGYLQGQYADLKTLMELLKLEVEKVEFSIVISSPMNTIRAKFHRDYASCILVIVRDV